MNQRIQELIRQSTNEVNSEFDKEKFAELIVRDCAVVARNNTPYSEELEYGRKISNRIKIHFGLSPE